MQTCYYPAQCCLNSCHLFRLAGYRPVSCEINAEMAPGLGARFGGLRCSVLSDGWHCKFWIRYSVRLTVAKDVERSNRTVFSVLANKLWLMDPARAGVDSAMWLARLENRLALGYETARGRRVRAACGCDLRHRILRSNRAVGLG